jgi:hypothetical protein
MQIKLQADVAPYHKNEFKCTIQPLMALCTVGDMGYEAKSDGPISAYFAPGPSGNFTENEAAIDESRSFILYTTRTTNR